MGIDVGSISTKGVITDAEQNILAEDYLWTEGSPINAVKALVARMGDRTDAGRRIAAVGVTGSARRLVGAITDAVIVKNEITAHAVGATARRKDVRTIIEIGGQDSKIILVNNGLVTDYAMNTLCAAGTGAFLSAQAGRLGVAVEDFGAIAVTSARPTPIAARCTVFAESDLVHKAQMGHSKEDIIAGLCKAIVANYLNNVAKGKRIEAPVVFQGGVSKNIGVVRAFEDALGLPVIVDENGHLMGALGAAILAQRTGKEQPFRFSFTDVDFVTRGRNCAGCANACEIVSVYRDGVRIDAWGNRCEKGASVACATLEETGTSA